MSHRLAVNLFFFLNGLVFANWAARIPQIQSDFVLDNKFLGLVLLAHSIGAFIGMPITGWLINKWSSRVITILSSLFFVLFFALIPWVPESGFWVFVPFFFMGASTGIMDVAMNAQAVDVEKHLGKPIMTMFHALFSIGMVVGGLTGGYFTTLDTALALHFSLVAGICFVVIAVTSKFLFPDDTNSDEEEVLFAWPKGTIIGLGIIAFCCMMGEGAMADWSTNYMKYIVEAKPEMQTLGLTAFAAMMTTGRLFGDRGRLLIGDRKMMISGAIISVFGMILIVGFPHWLLAIAGFGMVGLGLSNIVPIVFSLAGSNPNIKPGVGIAMATTIGYSGFMIGPPLIGFIADSYDLRISMIPLLVIFIIMLLLVVRQNAENLSKS